MSEQSVYLALNGKEARDLLKIHLNKKIDSTPLLSVGNSFHKLIMVGAIELTSYPADFEFPDIEFEILLESPISDEETGFKIDKNFKKIEDITNYREKLIQKLSELDEILEKAAPQEIIEVNINGVVPDEARLSAGLPVPVLKTVSDTGRKAEVESTTPRKLVNVGGR